MPIFVTIDETLGVLFLRSEGAISDAELYTAVQKGFSDPHFHPDLRLLADHTQGDFSNITSAGMARVANLNKFSLTARRAVLTRGALQKGIGRVLDAQHDIQGKASYWYFEDRSAALAFLNEGLPPEKHVR